MTYYGPFVAAGVAAAFFLGSFQIRLFRKDINDFFILAASGGLGGIIGAKLLYFAVAWKEIDFSRLTDIKYLNALMAGGFVFYGGLIGAILTLLFCSRILRADVFSYVNICVPCIPLAHGFGRLGCGAVGCCYGIPYDGPFSVIYHHSMFAPNYIELFPVQRLEAVLNFLIALGLLFYIDRKRNKKKYSLYIYLLLYAAMRFMLEFFRNDSMERGIYGIFSTSQWISIFIVVSVFIILFFNIGRKRYLRITE